MSLEALPFDSINESNNETTHELTFHNACDKGNLKVVKVYLAQPGFDMNVHDDVGDTGFHLACSNGNLNVVQFLVQQGFDMNIGDEDGTTGFHLACYNGKLNVVQFLVQQGFDMNISDNNGYTGFHWACIDGILNVVEFLVQQGFDMNVGDDDGSTGFHYACHFGHLDVFQFLLQQGFCINHRDTDGDTGLRILINNRHYFCQKKLFMPCILLLIEAGAELDESFVFEELTSAIQNRIIEITFMKDKLFEKWTGRIAQAITDYTMHSFTNTGLQNLSQFLNYNVVSSKFLDQTEP